MVSKPETFETGYWRRIETGNRRTGSAEAEQEAREGQPAASRFSPFAALAPATRRRVSRFRFAVSGLQHLHSPLPESSRPSRGLRAPALQLSGFRSPVSGFESSPASGFPFLAIRGRVGERVYKTYGDKIIVTRVPRFDGYEPSAAQRDRREKMRAATAYARAVYSDPAAKAVYVAAAKQLGRQPFRLAVSDFLRGHTRVTLDPATTRPRTTRKGSELRPGDRPRVVCTRKCRAQTPARATTRRSGVGLVWISSRAAGPRRAWQEHDGKTLGVAEQVTGGAASWGLPVFANR